MALDEALAESVRNGGLPFLRFYAWNPATLSLGRFQNLQTGFTSAVTRVPLVRRPTGGGGIWHADELTYSLGCRQDDLDVVGVKASFERLCGFLVKAWRSLGWQACFAKDAVAPGPLGGFTPACFAGQEEYDILVGGRKLGGNAQKRDRQTIFQHGSLPFTLDHNVLASLFLSEFRPSPLAVTDLMESGWRGSRDQLVTVLADAFRSHLGVVCEEAEPTAAEQARAQQLNDELYSGSLWTETGNGRLRGE